MAEPTRTTVMIKGQTEPAAVITPPLTTPAEIRNLLRTTAQALNLTLDRLTLINSGPGYKAQTYYIELTKEPKK